MGCRLVYTNESIFGIGLSDGRMVKLIRKLGQQMLVCYTSWSRHSPVIG